MITVFAPLALTAFTGALLALPLTPALRELLSKRDAGPLVTRKDDGNIENFAHALRARCQSYLPDMVRFAELGIDEALESDGEKIFVSGRSDGWHGPSETNDLILRARSVRLPDNFRSFGDFVAQESVHSGDHNVFRALLSDGAIVLGNGTQIFRWVHAEFDLVADMDCALFGRASAGKFIVLSPGCKFERMHAPVIYSSAEGRQLPVRQTSSAFYKLAQAGIGRKRIHGRSRLSAGEEHRGDLVGAGPLHAEEGTCVFGSVKANGPIELDNCSEVDGSLVSTHSIHISSRCFVKGPLIAEHEIVIGSEVQIGLPGTPTTLSAPHIRLAPGSVLYGTVWARVEGCVGD